MSDKVAPARAAQKGGSMAAFVIFTTGIIGCYSTYAWLQEGLRKPQEDGTKFSHTTLSLVVQCFVGALLAWLLDIGVSVFTATAAITDPDATEARKQAKEADTRASLWTPLGLLAVAEVSFTFLLAMFFSNEALVYVPYPMQVLAKSCKMIPVLIGETLVQGKRHSVEKWICVAVMAAGVGTFQLSRIKPRKLVVQDAASAGGESGDDAIAAAIGAALLLGSLVLDGYTGPRQKTIQKAYYSTTLGFMAIQNFLAGLMALAALAVSGSLVEGVTYVVEHPALIDDLLIFAAASAAGQTFIFGMLFYFDSLILTTVTTTRKFVSILISVFANGHSLGPVQWFSVLMVFGSIVYDKVVVPMRKASAAISQHDSAAKARLDEMDRRAKGAVPVDSHPTIDAASEPSDSASSSHLTTPEMVAMPFGKDGVEADHPRLGASSAPGNDGSGNARMRHVKLS